MSLIGDRIATNCDCGARDTNILPLDRTWQEGAVLYCEYIVGSWDGRYGDTGWDTSERIYITMAVWARACAILVFPRELLVFLDNPHTPRTYLIFGSPHFPCPPFSLSSPFSPIMASLILLALIGLPVLLFLSLLLSKDEVCSICYFLICLTPLSLFPK